MNINDAVVLQGILVMLTIIAISLMIIVSRLKPPKKTPPQAVESKA